MNVEGFLGSEEERAARRLIDQASGALKNRGGDVANDFVGRLFAHASPEDLIGYSPDEIAAVAFSGTAAFCYGAGPRVSSQRPRATSTSATKKRWPGGSAPSAAFNAAATSGCTLM